jgi:hypothetical protein
MAGIDPDVEPNVSDETQIPPISNGTDPAEGMNRKAKRAAKARQARAAKKAKANGDAEAKKPAAEPKANGGAKKPIDPLGPEPPEEGPDPFDPASLRVDPKTMGDIANRVLTDGQVAVRKPRKREFFRVHSDPAFREIVAAIILKEEMGETYLVAPHLANALSIEIDYYTVLTCMNNGGNIFLWCCPTEKEGTRRQNNWHKSAREAAKLAMTDWVRMIPNTDGGCYDLYTGDADLAVLEWPKGKTFRDLLKLGFGEDGIIRNIDHPLIKRLRGKKL